MKTREKIENKHDILELVVFYSRNMYVHDWDRSSFGQRKFAQP